jgi:hypothetical protein
MMYRLTISDLVEVLAALKEIARPYQLGIQLEIDSSELDTIEKNHPRDIGRQKTEVIKYWLRNSPDASWTTLANAVERMGGHARLAETLREKEIKSEEEKQNTSPIKVERMEGRARFVDAVERVISKNKEERRTTSIYYVSTPSVEDEDFPRCNPWPRFHSDSCSLDECVDRNILLLGKMGHGTSTLGNKILDRDG